MLCELNPQMTIPEIFRITEVMWQNEPEEIRRIYDPQSVSGNRKNLDRVSKKSKITHPLPERKRTEFNLQPVRTSIQGTE